MPNHKSAEKRVRTNEKANIRNRAIRSSVKTAMNRILGLTSKDEAVKGLKEAYVVVDKACQKGVLHKNNASHKKSRMASHVNGLK